MKNRWLLLNFCFCFVCAPAILQAAMIVRIRDLQFTPLPPNPIKVVGKVVDIYPTKVSDGVHTIQVVGTTLEQGQHVVLEGNFNNNILTVTNRSVVRKKYVKLLTLGNSITFSPPGAWNGNQQPGWGMNASAQANDYVHLIISRMQQEDPQNASIHYTSTGSGVASGKITDLINNLPLWKSYKADLITIQIGENDKPNYPPNTVPPTTQFSNNVKLLLDGLLDNNPKPRIFVFGVWNGQESYSSIYWPRNADNVLALECYLRGIPFRKVNTVSANPNTSGPITDPILWHPNDLGMAGYRDLFWAAMGPEIAGD